MVPLERAILNTLVWFDLWHQPLTAFECWYFLWNEDGLVADSIPSEVSSALISLENKKLVKINRNFWQLADSPSYTEERLARARWSIGKRQRAERVAKLIMKLPFVRLVALANTNASEGAKRDSDIDLLIIVKAGRIFLSRLLITTLVQLLGWRRHGVKVANRICLSFYLADNELNIKSLAYPDDPYLIYWLASLQPLADFGTFNNLLADNAWAQNFIPHRYLVFKAANTQTVANSKLIWPEQALVGRLGDVLEYGARRLQLFLISRHKDSRLGDGSSAVVVSNNILKFHESDQRPQLAKNFRERQQQILAKYI
ncbi:MAG: hypothetical protein A2388_02795 [Candidatus Veblenbacteria bacterium RIFOXYB1_FULL_43_13]|uniref:Polymerase nucleotidyl transferase domain-containing protein n=1 Tax=Candidatus Veblenbacteria bacterium RIFOXYB1_FULL_43_13 TaxID=1802426 RepID=A0A1G2Q539_9BACT|nr:MAG: hypothetical protein A2388_02795 [Candidatus Veblenbacteria bacterium RIFOXYB1_FULL_43_13]